MDIQSHPCFSAKCQPQGGRIHLPVAPLCNISCRFCQRGISRNRELPGNALKIISPEEALSVMEAAMRLCPELKVVGVAGPGDPLASHHALDALSLIKGEYPDLISCLSTNGLMLPENMERMLLSGVEALTVTVNSVDPRILSHINRFVLYKGSLLEGIEAQEILIDAQMRGIKLARENSMIVKINTVLIPGVNDGHVPEIARKVKEWGAEILNIIPLIPAGELSHLSPPSSDDYRRASQSAERELPVKMNCRRCRADACGVPGVSDYSREIYGEITFEETFSHG